VISYLDRGDLYDLATHLHAVAAKAGGKLRPRRPGGRPVFSPDILGRNALVELMENLMNNRRSEAIGIATSGRNTPLPELGFQFTLSKTRDSVGYASAAPQSYSILRMRLDIRPLDIGQSLRHPAAAAARAAASMAHVPAASMRSAS
jgi:cyanophycinase